MMPSPHVRAPEGVERTSASFRRVLVCLDCSRTAEAALPIAAQLAGIEGASLTIVHVLDGIPYPDQVHATDALEWEIVREEARAYLGRIVEWAGTLGAVAQARLAEGATPHRIAALADELNADLVVLCTRGKGETPGAWKLGATARKILAMSKAPVLVVPVDGREAPADRALPTRILVPLDGSVRGEHVLPVAVRLARCREAEVLLAHVVGDPVRTELLSTEDDLALARELSDRLTRRAEDYLQRVRERLEASGVRARTLVRRATDHREGLVALATGEDADLTLMSAHGSVCNPRRRFGSVTSYFVQHAPSPVLVMQDIPQWPPLQEARTQASRLPPRSFDAASSGA